MEVFISNTQNSAADEKVLTFLRNVGPSAWPILYSIWKRRNCGVTDGLSSKYFVDSVGEPTCVVEKCSIRGEEGARATSGEVKNENNVSAGGGAEDEQPNWHYNHITLCTSPELSEVEVARALDRLAANLSIPDWKGLLLFPFLAPSLFAEIEPRAKLNGGEVFREGLAGVYCHSAHHPQPAVPDGFLVKDLSVEDARLVNNAWNYGGTPRTLDYIRRNIANSIPGGAVGVYCKENVGDAATSENTCRHTAGECGSGSRERESLVSWGFVTTYGGVGILQTLPQFYRRGLAQIVIGKLVQALCLQSLPAYCCIEDDNLASIRCFTKAGFQRIPGRDVEWVHYFPEGCTPVDFHNPGESTKGHPGTCT